MVSQYRICSSIYGLCLGLVSNISFSRKELRASRQGRLTARASGAVEQGPKI